MNLQKLIKNATTPKGFLVLAALGAGGYYLYKTIKAQSGPAAPAKP